MATLIAAVVAGCDQPEWRGLAAEGADAASATERSRDPLPQLPAWFAPLAGRSFSDVFAHEAQCTGSTDRVAKRYEGASGGVTIVGWGWAPDLQKPPPRIVLVDAASRIVGGGESGLERLDVPIALPQITSNWTGWWALTSAPNGAVEAYGVLPDGRTCSLGHLDL